MNGELFKVETVLSPRLAWLKRHGLETEHIPEGGRECPETGDEIPNWVCRVILPAERMGCHYRPNEIGGGDTEEEACADFAVNAGIRLWNEE
jgi:hypothetical protein